MMKLFANPDLRVKIAVVFAANASWPMTVAIAQAPYCWVYQESDLPPGSNEAGSEFCKFTDGTVFKQMCGVKFTLGQDTRACIDPKGVLAKGHKAL
jgi:hypothetical protein